MSRAGHSADRQYRESYKSEFAWSTKNKKGRAKKKKKNTRSISCNEMDSVDVIYGS